MSDNGRNNNRKIQVQTGIKVPPRRVKRKPKPKFHGGTFVAMFVLLFVVTYMATAAYAYLNRSEIPTVEIKIDVIDTQKGVIQGVIIRHENVLYSNGAGLLEFTAPDKERVRKGTTLFYITDVGDNTYVEPASSLSGYGGARGGQTTYSEAQIKEIIEKSVQVINGTDMSEIYVLKNAISDVTESNVKGMQSSTAPNVYSADIFYFEQDNRHTKSQIAEKSGILSYSTDGLEDVLSFNAIEALTLDQTLLKPEGVASYAKQNVEANIPVAKVITGNDWYIAAYVKNEFADVVKDETRKLFLQQGENVVEVEMTVFYIREGAEQTYIVFKSTKNIIDYADMRSVTFKLTDSAKSGLKVPNSAIVSRTFVKVPEHIVKDATVIKKTPQGEQRVSVTVNRTNAPPGFTYILLDYAKFAIGDTLMPHDTSFEEYVISESDFTGFNGVYRVIGPTAKFVCINDEDMVSAGGYTILEPAKNQALRPYDIIVIDGSAIRENQVLH